MNSSDLKYLHHIDGFHSKVGYSYLYNTDFLNVLYKINAESVGLILADLPYGVTQARFDSVIKMEREYVGEPVLKGTSYEYDVRPGLWDWYNLVLKKDGLVILTAKQPFASYLIMSAPEYGFKLQQEWIWEKTQATGHLNSKRLPMQAHENVLVFQKKKTQGHTYNPQMTEGHERKVSSAAHKNNTTNNQSEVYGKSDNFSDYDSTTRFPRSVLKFASDKQKSALHPTQKPVSFVGYLLSTYSNIGDLVLDNVAGSLTTTEACNNLGRYCIAIEKDETYFQKGLTRFK